MLEWLHQLHSAEGISQIIQAGGLIALIAIIFAETGLLVGFFLPGDSLLVTAGVLANPENPNHVAALGIVLVNVLLVISAIVGDQVNFLLGHKVGDAIWDRPDGRLYKRKYMEEAHEFYMRYGGLAIAGGRFVPIMRTFVPFAAGVARMPYGRFIFWNVAGGVVWVTSLLWIGYFIGQTAFADRLDKVIVLVILISFLPIVFGVLKRWLTKRKPAGCGCRCACGEAEAAPASERETL
jgi:membrane-associated protein